MRESELLAHILAASRTVEEAYPWVVAGPGHDCAVVATGSGECTLLKVDQVVSGLHFRPYPATTIDLISRKAVARAVSDVAAAGGTPRAALCAAVIPARFGRERELFDALSKWAMHWGCPLVGGDTAVMPAASDAPLTLGITVQGLAHPRRGPVLRSGAQPGDNVYITGALGGSFERDTGLGRHLTFEPRLREAHWLCDTFGESLHAMMDVSDGLGRDAARLASASAVRICIDAASLPLAPGVVEWRSGAGDGEDYELLFAVPRSAPMPPCCPGTGTSITRIGYAEAGTGCLIRDPAGGEHNGAELGWDPGTP